MKETNKIAKATQALTQVADSYRIEDGVAAGLIDKADIDNAVIDSMTAFARAYIDSPAEVVELPTNPDMTKAFAELTKGLRGQVFTGKLRRTVNNDTGEVTVTPVTDSPRVGINYQDIIFKKVEEKLMATYHPKTPTLEHDPNAVRYLEICRDLFPNVAKPHVAANAFRDLIENVHNSCHTTNAKFVQKAMWLYSLKTGGTGKSFFLGLLHDACNELGIDASYENFKESNYLSPTCGMHTVTISEDTPKLDSSMAETLNTLIDRSTFKYNIKWGASGLAKSEANLVMGSNYISFESNTRRYNQVEYIQYNLTEALKEDDKMYFPLWENQEKGVELVKEAFKVCPFKSEHASWDKVTINDCEEEAVEVDDRYGSTLLAIQETVASCNITYDAVTHMRPTQFAKKMVADGYGNYKETVGALRNFLTELKSSGKLPSRMCEGRAKIEATYFDWTKIAKMKWGETDNGNFLANIHDEWNNLIINETNANSNNETFDLEAL